jgi:hypothetical protein
MCHALQVGEDRMFRIAFCRLLFLSIERLDTHELHESRNVPAADTIASFPDLVAQLPCAHDPIPGA